MRYYFMVFFLNKMIFANRKKPLIPYIIFAKAQKEIKKIVIRIVKKMVTKTPTRLLIGNAHKIPRK